MVAASQNIQGAQRYLAHVQFPYCNPPEVATLDKAVAYIYTDMQTDDRHGHALACYSTTSKRCGALLQWIHQVSATYFFVHSNKFGFAKLMTLQHVLLQLLVFGRDVVAVLALVKMIFVAGAYDDSVWRWLRH